MIRTLSLDAVQKAESGHPGLALRDAIKAIFMDARHNPQN